jgi:nitrogen-specific signal transduction histidine kinase
MRPDPEPPLDDPGLAKTSLIRELVDLSRFTEGILRTLGSGIVAVDGNGRITFVNPAAETLIGRPARDLVGRPADAVLVTRGGGGLLENAPFPEGIAEVDLVLEDERIITVEVRLSRQEDAGVVAILTDRTDLKRAEQEARRKERLASLGALSAGVAHEIRNPLAGIGASAQLLRSRMSGTEHVQLADLILDEVARLDRIVENMLQFSRPAQPNLRLEDVRACVERALGLVMEEASRNGVTVETTFPPDIPRVWIDPDQMVQVVLNLMQNAVQAAAGGEVRVALRRVSRRPYVRRRSGRRREDRGRVPGGQPPPQDWVELEIADDGHGVSPENLERLFDPFYTTRKDGTGLGLSITQAIVQEHCGMISCSSEPGRGTTFLVDLPVEKRQRRRRAGA